MGSLGTRSLGTLGSFRLRCWPALLMPAIVLACGCDRHSVETSVPPSAAIESPSQLADEPPSQLGIGDPNPGLKLAKWIKGEPVQTPLTGKVHVVEFWATWCGPCRVGMPHISELQSEYGEDVTFIGVTREDEATVASFLQSESPDGRNWQEVIQYRLAIDQDDWTNTAYMKAAGQNGIPCAFVVGRDGVVEWIGHPASIDEPLQQIVAGQYDRDRAIAEFKQRERMQEVALEVNRLVRAKDWDGALKLLDELESESGKSSSMMAFRLNILEVAGRAAEASAVRAELVELAWDDAGQLNAIAWQTATSGDGTDRELALKAAQRASELRDDEDPAILDTLARCHYELGDLDEAIRWQRQAVEHNAGHPEIDETLQSYLKEQAAATEPATSPEAALSPPEGEPAEPSEQPAVDRDS